jgi:pimeloyl-ACP methyl ester carboxylesterase
MRYIDVGDGQLFMRQAGSGSGLPLLMLPPAPGGSDQILPLMQALENSRPVLAIDPPGSGYSDAVTQETLIPAWAEAISTALDYLGIDRAALYARHGGSALAAELAKARPDRFVSVVLDAPTVIATDKRETLAAQYCPQLAPRWDGAHLVALWHFVRDQRLWWPWFAHDRAGIHPNRPDLDVDCLHREASLLALNMEAIAPSWQAVLRHPLQEQLQSLSQPLMIGADSHDPFAPCLHEARACRPDAIHGDFGPSKHATIRAFLRGL